MSYASLRGHSDRPLCQHMNETPSVSPCRECEFRSHDKNSHPDCINCLKRSGFYTRPINLDIKHDITDPALTKRPTRKPRAPSPQAIPKDAKCSVPGCENSARYNHFKKTIYRGLICQNHYIRFYRRWTRRKTIYDQDGNL